MPGGLRAVVATALGSALLVGCTSTVTGSGFGSGTPTPTQSTPSTTIATSASSSATASGSSSTPTSKAPVVAAPPPQCPGGTCDQLATAGLGSGFVVTLRSGHPTDGSVGASVIELTQNGVPVFWHAVNGETPEHLTCKSSGAAPSCVVIDVLGAHAANATAWLLTGSTLARGDTVTSATPSAFGRDLNADGLVDVIGLQNDYTPDYATGHVQWQTWRSDGRRLTSTGCGPLSVTPPAQPAGFLTGKCSGG